MLTQRRLRNLSLPLNQSLIHADNTASMTLLRQHPAPARPTVEDLIGRIAALVLVRQALRKDGSDRETLEENRRQLVDAHWDLSRALIERHCAPKADVQAA